MPSGVRVSVRPTILHLASLTVLACSPTPSPADAAADRGPADAAIDVSSHDASTGDDRTADVTCRTGAAAPWPGNATTIA